MHLKDATRFLGSVGILTPLILIILTAADSALACPGHTTGVSYRTRSANTRTVSMMPTTVISYRAPASYRRCGDSLIDTRGSKYVAVRRTIVNNNGGARVVAIRSGGGYYTTNRTRYIAVRNADFYDAPRYVAVRRVEPSVRVIGVRSGYRTGNGIVYDTGDPNRQYVAVRRAPTVRYVAVRNMDEDYDMDHVRYVAVRNVSKSCNCSGQIGTVSARRVVYSTGTKYVSDDDDDYIASSTTSRYVDADIDDDDDDIVVQSAPVTRTKVVAVDDIDDDEDAIVPVANVNTSTSYVEYAPAAYYSGDDSIASNHSPAVLSSRTVNYIPASYNDDDNVNDLAYLDGGGATYIANDDIEDACMRRSSREVSYVAVEDVDDSPTYVVTRKAAMPVRYVAVSDDDRIDTDTAYVMADDTDSCSCPIALQNDISDVPVHEVVTENVSYMPIEDTHQALRVVPANNVTYVATDDDDDCATTVSRVEAEPIAVVHDSATTLSSVETEPVELADSSTEVAEGEMVADLNSGRTIAGQYGYHDGYEDGREAALEGDVYHPENSGDYQKATEGYEDTFGDKDAYRDSYRSSYLDGYRAGFDSASGRG